MNEMIIEINQEKFLGVERAKGESENYTLYHNTKGKKKYILSKYFPKDKVEKWIDQYESGAETVWIICGFEVGYTLECLLTDERKNNRFLIIEPYEEVLNQQKKFVKNIEMLSDERVEIFTGDNLIQLKEIILSKTEKSGLENVNILLMESYKEVYSEYWLKIIRTIGEVKASKQLNMNTALGTVETIMYNIIRNQKHIQKSYDIEEHKNKYKDIPAVIVSAGPSLNENIELIKEFNGLIFTGGRTVEKVVEQGKEPTFLISIDDKDIIYETLGSQKENGIPFITMANSNWQLPLTNYGPQYFIDNTGYNDIVEQLLGIRLPEIICGGSVATMCLSVAQYMGCNPIIFIGQDLAFTNMQSHATGTYNIEKFQDKASHMKYIPGYYEEAVLSDVSLIEFLRWIEEFISIYNETTYINATEGGAKIQGTLQMSFQDAIEKYGIKGQKIIHNKKMELNIDSMGVHVEKTLECLQVLIETVQKGEKYCKRILQEYEKSNPNMKNVEMLSGKLNKNITININQVIKENIGISRIIKLIEDKIYSQIDFREPLKETSLEANRRTVKRMERFYIEVKEICRNAQKAITKALKSEEEESGKNE